MRSFLYALTIATLSVSVVFGGEKDNAAEEAWIKTAIAKESQRAKDALQHHSNIERFEGKYGWIKESQPEKYAALMTANKNAAAAWSAVAKESESAKHPEELSTLKIPAHAAAAGAYLAEIDLKYAGAASGRKDMTEKSGSDAVEALASKLDANEQSMLEAHRAKNSAAARLQSLELENRQLNKALHTAYQDARSAAKAKEETAHKKK